MPAETRDLRRMFIPLALFSEGRKPDRLPTGIEGLDKLIEGGISFGESLLIEGLPGSGKTVFSRQMLVKTLASGVPCIYIVTTEPVDSVKQQMMSFGWDLEKANGLLAFIDAYSCQAEPEKAKTLTGALHSIHDLNELNELIKLEAARLECAKKGGFILLDSLSDFIIYGSFESVAKFIKLLSGNIRANKSVALLCIESGVHPDNVMATINYLTSGTIELKVNEQEQRMLRISRLGGTMHTLKWIEFTISGKGINVEVEEFFKK
ncbi:hypothetical protein HZB89_02050 [archaeon]|nr:hypothetical protein [archaeon]